MSEAICELSRAIANKQVAVLTTIVEVKDASPAKVGAQLVLFENGSTTGTVGGGHIGRPLKIMAEAAGFDAVVVDVVAGNATAPELEQVELNDDSYVVLITTDHVSDEAAMRVALRTPVPYIGMIGSLAKWQAIREHLVADGIQEDDLTRIFAPIGLDLGGDKPQEIAVAILSEVLAVRFHHHNEPVQFRRTRLGKHQPV